MEICRKRKAFNNHDGQLIIFHFIKRHVETVHEGKRPYNCEKCGKGFARKDNFHTHVANACKDMKVKPQQCTLCDFTCQYMTQLKKHLEEVHGETQIYSCHLCGAKYGEKVSLKYHIEHTHEGKKKAGLYISMKFLNLCNCLLRADRI